MKSFVLLVVFLSIFQQIIAQSVSITKGQNVPDNVCENQDYTYVINCTVPSTGWLLKVKATLGSIDSQQTINGTTTITVTNKWTATTSSFNGKITAELSKVNYTTVSSSLDVTIKSIKHLEPEIVNFPSNGGVLTINPCVNGQYYLEVQKLIVPGTGSINPEKVQTYLWTLPSGWSMNG